MKAKLQKKFQFTALALINILNLLKRGKTVMLESSAVVVWCIRAYLFTEENISPVFHSKEMQKESGWSSTVMSNRAPIYGTSSFHKIIPMLREKMYHAFLMELDFSIEKEPSR